MCGRLGKGKELDIELAKHLERNGKGNNILQLKLQKGSLVFGKLQISNSTTTNQPYKSLSDLF